MTKVIMVKGEGDLPFFQETRHIVKCYMFYSRFEFQIFII